MPDELKIVVVRRFGSWADVVSQLKVTERTLAMQLAGVRAALNALDGGQQLAVVGLLLRSQ
jgi:hypothetical protein